VLALTVRTVDTEGFELNVARVDQSWQVFFALKILKTSADLFNISRNSIDRYEDSLGRHGSI